MISNKFTQQDIFSLQVLNPLFNGSSFLPITSSSINPSSLLIILNDIIINKRTSIIEFGSGLSTIIIARLIKLNKLNVDYYTVDENEQWLNEISQILKKDGNEELVQKIHAPLNDTSLSLNDIEWYSTDKLNECVANKKFDLVIVDGPSAWHKKIQLSRYPAFPYAANKLKDSFSLFLDDSNREGEKIILDVWKKNYNLEYSLMTESLACIQRNSFLNINI